MAATPVEEETRKVIALLGGAKVFQRKINDPSELQRALRRVTTYSDLRAHLKRHCDSVAS